MGESLHKSEKRLSMLQDRVKRCVCKACGNSLVIRQLDFHDYEGIRLELYCESCDRLEFGMEPEVFAAAEYYVEECQMNLFPDLGNTESARKMTIARVAEMMNWALEHLGYLNMDGYRVPPDMEGKLQGECLVLDDGLLEKLDEELKKP